MRNPLEILCEDYEYYFSEKGELELRLINVSLVKYGPKDVTDICRINRGEMKIRNLHKSDNSLP